MGISPQRREKQQRSGRFSQKKTTEETKADVEKQTQRSTKARKQSKKQEQQAEGRNRNLPSFFCAKSPTFQKIRGFIPTSLQIKIFFEKTLDKNHRLTAILFKA